jgi:hypothetical protein
MASTYSDLKIELIATGEQSGTWGSTTNTNLGTALEEAIVGRANAVFSSDADLTISLTNVNTTQVARNYILNVTSGVSLTTTRNLIVPTINKPYIIENNTTGAQSIIVKTTAGTGVTVPNGKRMMVYADGTNVVPAFNEVPSGTTVSGEGAIVGTTGTQTLTNKTLTSPTINTATISGGTINNASVGATTRSTGAFTTLTSNGATTFTAGTASTSTTTGTAVITGGLGVSGRINAANIDGIIGANTAAAGTFTNLAYTGTLTGGTGVINIGSGQVYKDASGNVGIGVTNPSSVLHLNRAGSTETAVKFTNGGGASSGFVVGANSTGAGLVYHIDNQPILFATNNTERMRITSDGNVGIGTSSPTLFRGSAATTSLSIAGGTNIAGESVYSGYGQQTAASFNTYANSSDGFIRRLDICSFGDSLGGGAGSIIRLLTQTTGVSSLTERMRIDASGNVGIGAAPDNAANNTFLRVNNSSGLGGGIVKVSSTNVDARLQAGVSEAFVGTFSNHPALFYTNSTEKMRIDSSGNVGIGTSSPGGRLHVQTATSATVIQLTNSSGTSEWQQNGNDLFFSNYNASGAAIFRTNGAERMRIDSDGRVLVGTSDSAVSATNNGFFIDRSTSISQSAPSANANCVLYKPASAAQTAFMFFNTDNTFIASITQNGNSAVSYNTTSDYRLKNDVTPIENALDKVALLKPVNWKWKVDGSHGEGFIAHELAEVIPYAVSGKKDAVDKEGKPVHQGVDTSFLVATLTAAIQELSAKVDTLQAKLNTLKGN